MNRDINGAPKGGPINPVSNKAVNTGNAALKKSNIASNASLPGTLSRQEMDNAGFLPHGEANPRYNVGRLNRHVQQTGGLMNGKPQFNATGIYRNPGNHARVRDEIMRHNPKLTGGFYVNGRLIR